MTFRTGPGVLTGYDAGVMDLRMSGGPFFEDFSDDKFLRGEDAPVNKEFAAFEVIVFYQCGNNALDGSNAGSGSEEDGFTALRCLESAGALRSFQAHLIADADHVGEEHAREHTIGDFADQEFDGLFLVLRAGDGVIAFLVSGKLDGVGLAGFEFKDAAVGTLQN